MDIGEYRPSRPFSSLISGFGAGEEIQTGALRRDLMRTALQDRQEVREALGEYKDTGDPNVLRGISPELAIRVKDHLDKQTPEALKGYEKAADFIQRSRGVLTEGNWPAYKSTIEQQGWIPPGTLPDKFNRQFLYMPELMKEHIKTLGAKPTVHDFGSSTGGVQPMQYDSMSRSWVPVGPVKNKEFAPRETPDEAAAKERARQGVRQEYGDVKYRFPQFKADYLKEHPEASNDEMWDAYKSGGKIGKVYSVEDQNKVLLDKVMAVINGPPPNKLKKEWEAADPAGKEGILKREIDVMRPVVFPESSGRKGSGKPTQVQQVPDPATNKYMRDPSGKYFESDGIKWNPVR